MSEKKTIQINPDLFKISNKSNTRKKNTDKPPKIELKSSIRAQKQKTLRKNVLKMIREKQQEAYRNLFEKKKIPDSSSSSEQKKFDKDFDSSLEFFSSLATKVESEPNPTPSSTPNSTINSTIKNYSSINSPLPSTIISPTLPPPVVIPTDSIQIPNSLPDFSKTPTITPSINIIPQPQFGCLKNGELPTYRSYTRKNHIGGTLAQPDINPSFVNPVIHTDNPFDTPLLTSTLSTPSIMTPKFIEQSQKFEKIHGGQISNEKKAERKIRYRKRKKIFKRTYKIGRSKTEPKVGVLVSNKTIRSRISTQAQLLKQTSIQDVRRFLIKKGFIKVGTNAPNDVLRKMYETVSLVCGEIQNHNPDNLLYNFIHDQA
jgi:type II secretory pathway pseudopilin PulG